MIVCLTETWLSMLDCFLHMPVIPEELQYVYFLVYMHMVTSNRLRMPATYGSS